MLNVYQQTITKPISFRGIGLHSGKKAEMTIYPGIEDQGIIFKRVDLQKDNVILANYKSVSSARLCTTLENKSGTKVSTVEHLLAALYVSEIDNAVIEIDSEEVPIMDGSARNFVEIFKKTELKTLNKKRKYLKVLKKISLNDGEKNISIEPNNQSFEVNFKLSYKNKIIGNQSNKINFQIDDLKEICESRTFCLFEDIQKIKKIGLAKGGSLENALVVDNDKVLNDQGLRNEKEFANHKILDLAGDFLLSGYRVLGKVNCYQGGHALTNTFLKKLLNEKLSISVLELKDDVVSKKIDNSQSIKLAASA
ncbi:UDP-3-O-acyl-N-acetylglucosamine deacetylase [Candidatus Pelagibacter communis]|uniref:UDP-3-O-acyl-N-acetylglucosamine deacetylase n=1 Tax=Pelagibacter ubique TaxID=198252 RepID=UPI00094C495D|nr:UDP-3-O-acyl-N-acetylglucosamine deacetylase [Candidatus Pelagibacter ubique]|tara:strand:+ start:77 stop:1003 length:927 start_codon:yes stop_codon:yes gene_type:complete